MKTVVFDYKDYKPYLIKALEDRLVIEKGQRSKLSKFIGCQPAYLSQVLNGSADFSAEQAVAVNQFLSHTVTEARFFLNLVLLARAGTKDLRIFYQQEIKKLLDDRLILKDRINMNRTLSEADQARYYSSWHFAAIHVIVSLANFRTRHAIAEALNLSPKIVNPALEFLVEIGILKMIGFDYHQGETSLHLGSDSPFIQKHHSNWRMKTLQSLEQPKSKDLHYSSVITCSKDDYAQVRELMIQTVQKIRGLIKESKDEVMAAYTLDLIGLTEKDELD
jgi:uncharacterized protein (TIGR02147 family)